MTAQVEVLQIECVVPGLVVVGYVVLALSTLELDRKDGRPADHDGVDPTPEPRHVEFKVDRPLEPVEGLDHNRDLLFPGASLGDLQVVRVSADEHSQNLRGRFGEELLNGRPVVGGSVARPGGVFQGCQDNSLTAAGECVAKLTDGWVTPDGAPRQGRSRLP